jgi:hypothetical protein
MGLKLTKSSLMGRSFAADSQKDKHRIARHCGAAIGS